jgi:hypothetical protein
MFDYYFSLDEKTDNKDYRDIFTAESKCYNDWDFEELAQNIVKEYENNGDYIRSNNVEVYIWDDKDNYIGQFTVAIDTTRVYYANKVRE